MLLYLKARKKDKTEVPIYFKFELEQHGLMPFIKFLKDKKNAIQQELGNDYIVEDITEDEYIKCQLVVKHGLQDYMDLTEEVMKFAEGIQNEKGDNNGKDRTVCNDGREGT